MPATALAVRLVASNDIDVSEIQVRRVLKPYGLRVRKTCLSTIVREDIDSGVLFVSRKEGHLLIIPSGKMKSLVGNRRRKESRMRFSTMKMAGITFDDAFSQRLVEGYKIIYCGQEIAVVVNASRFVEQLV